MIIYDKKKKSIAKNGWDMNSYPQIMMRKVPAVVASSGYLRQCKQDHHLCIRHYWSFSRGSARQRSSESVAFIFSSQRDLLATLPTSTMQGWMCSFITLELHSAMHTPNIAVVQLKTEDDVKCIICVTCFGLLLSLPEVVMSAKSPECNVLLPTNG